MCAVSIVIVHQFVGPKGDLLNVLICGILGAAAVVSVRYIYRNRSR